MATVGAGAPELPHVTFNMTPLDVLLQRTALDAFKQLKEYLQHIENVGEQETPDKIQFLDMLVVMRERFVKLYVLCKWCRNHEAVGRLIDIFAWLREQNQMISTSILQFGEIKGSLMAAKMLEPDLNTAMEVFSKGRPDLPTYNYLPSEPLDPQFVGKVMRNLNVELSIKMALEVNLPPQFLNYEIKDGRVSFDIVNHFKCSVSMLKDEKFNLIDFKFGFQLINNKIVSDVQDLEPQALTNLQNIANQKLVENNNNLHELFELLFDYSATFKLQLIHKQLVNLKLSLWRGHLSHTYDTDSKVIKVTYWTQKRFVKPSYIEIGLFNNNKLSFKWFKNTEEVILEDGFELVQNDGSIDLERVLNELIKRHIEMDISDIKSKLIGAVSQLDRALSILPPSHDKLLFKITQSREIIYGIDKLSGSPYFENPTLLMNNIGFKINSTESMDYIELLRLKLEFQCNKLKQMMMTTGWLPVENVHILKEERLKLGIDYSGLGGGLSGEDLTNVRVYRRKDWQNGWFLMVGSFGWKSNIQLWCGRVNCVQGVWKLNWVDSVNFHKGDESVDEEETKQLANLEVVQFDDLVELVKIASSKLISNLVINEFERQGCSLKVLNLSDEKVHQFLKGNFEFDLKGADIKDSDNAVVLIKNDTWLKVQSIEQSLVLIITVKNSHLIARLYGKVVNFNTLPAIEFANESAKLKYSSHNKLVQVDCSVDLGSKMTASLSGPVDESVEGTELEKTGDDELLMSSVSDLLEQFSRLLNMLQMINQDPTLKITHADLECVGFTYGTDMTESVKLRLSRQSKGELSVELPQSNPHNVCLKYLNGLINSGDSSDVDRFNCMLIRQLVVYLKLTLQFYKSYQKLQSEQQVSFTSGMPNETPNNGFVLNLHGLENFTVSYYKAAGNPMDVRLDLSMDMRHKTRRLSLKDSLFMVSVGNLRGGNAALVQEVRATMDRLFSGEERISVTTGKVLPLRDSLCCDSKAVAQVLEAIHAKVRHVLEL